MKCWLPPRVLSSVLLGVAVALSVAAFWPSTPRLVLQDDGRWFYLAYSSDSAMLASLLFKENTNTKICVWTTATGVDSLGRFELRGALSSGLHFAPDGKTLGAIAYKGGVVQWDLASGKEVAHHDHQSWSHEPVPREILFSPEGQWLLHEPAAGRVYDVITGQVVKDYNARWPAFRDGLFLRDQRAYGGIVVVRLGDKLKTFDVLTGVAYGEFPLRPVQQMPPNDTFASAGTHYAFIDPRGRGSVYHGLTGSVSTFPIKGEHPGHDMLHLSADGRYVGVTLAESKQGMINELLQDLAVTAPSLHVFETVSGRALMRPIRNGRQCAFAPDGKSLAVAEAGEQISVWDCPPPSRWPLPLLAAGATTVISYSLALLWARLRKPAPASETHPEVGSASP